MIDKEKGIDIEKGIEITEMDRLLPYAHWLYNIKGLGSKTIKRLLSADKTREVTAKTLYHLAPEALEEYLPASARGRELARRIAQSAKNWDLYGNFEKLRERQIYFACLGHPAYPPKLSRIADAPYGIYYKGRLPEDKKPSVAIIGARSCSDYGRQMAGQFGKELAKAGVQVISGMARGIDGIGQKAALGAGGYSLGVMGCGVDICYPLENRDLYDLLCSHGGVCSEYLPGTEPCANLFPPRNRIISALADMVLVVEAKSRSGTLITVDMALEQGKEVYAVPGRVTEALSEGCNRLLQQGAGVAISPGEVIRSLTGKMPEGEAPFYLLSEIESDILQNLDDTPQLPEKIKERMLLNCARDIQMSELVSHLMKLRLNGFIRVIGNSYFMKA